MILLLDLKKINYKGFLTVELGFGYTVLFFLLFI